MGKLRYFVEQMDRSPSTWGRPTVNANRSIVTKRVHRWGAEERSSTLRVSTTRRGQKVTERLGSWQLATTNDDWQQLATTGGDETAARQ
ncbi:hypothetical protein E4U30_008328 [Claviceps sp. LM220 group G6]|nr:hypothetical protein E4U30_008328 [Claviceps sp. LM220 group G6]